MIIEFTEQELKVLMQLIDISVKAGGIQVAEAAVILNKKLQAALPQTETPKETE